jgi:hypothetical protein
MPARPMILLLLTELPWMKTFKMGAGGVQHVAARPADHFLKIYLGGFDIDFLRADHLGDVEPGQRGTALHHNARIGQEHTRHRSAFQRIHPGAD